MTKNAFTMIELIFVIVVLGILASIAIPKFAATREDAKISAARATVAAVRSGIVSERQKRMLRGDTTYITSLGDNFIGVLSYPAKDWTRSNESYSIVIGPNTCTYTYDNTTGQFTASSPTGLCTAVDY
ncbi:type II secretion system protein [Sulfurimonas sp. HSL-1656]|uniref:type II secretion system protein n=1 Tax=Thiomicrolovo subterrani TaxID=3131934 RepID=UPI0031F82DDF